MITLVDYGASNMKSVQRALRATGTEVQVTTDPDTVRRAERLVVPGVGHFAPARTRLTETGLDAAITEVARAGRPVLGICLGLQLLLKESAEAPGQPGLGLLPGRVKLFDTDLPVPHVGWAAVTITPRGRTHGVVGRAVTGSDAFYYHVHSYHPDQVDDGAALGVADYGGRFATIVGCDTVLGVQFHPEKSQAAGLALLSAFATWRP